MKTSLEVDRANQAQGNEMPTMWTAPSMTCDRTEQSNIQHVMEIQQWGKWTLANSQPQAMPAGIKRKRIRRTDIDTTSSRNVCIKQVMDCRHTRGTRSPSGKPPPGLDITDALYTVISQPCCGSLHTSTVTTRRTLKTTKSQTTRCVPNDFSESSPYD